MKRFNLFNRVGAMIAFAVAACTYLLTIEPTASFWDCGEFISSAVKLDVGHPPGAPFFMLTGRVWANLASSSETVARCLNAMSALFSALTILFLYLSISLMARKWVVKDSNSPTLGEIITVAGASLVGSLAYTFTDTFWFSAVEGEVYAYSSLFTAVVFWAMLKWEQVAEEEHSARWIIFIAYLTGLSIGVHLLNLLCITALVLIYYFKKAERPNFKGSVIAILVSFAIIAVVLYGIVPGVANMAGWFDLLFVNGLGMSFNSGALIYVVVMAGLLVWGLRATRPAGLKESDDTVARLAFALNLTLAGIPFVGHSAALWVVLLAAIFLASFLIKRLTRPLMNTILLSLMVMLIGYSSYSITVIRSSAQPPMDQNSPDNMFSLETYLNREQYGDTPLIFGQTFVSEVEWKREGNNCVPQYKKGAKVWQKKAKETPDEKDRYVVIGYNEKPIYTKELNMFFPRMYSQREDHIQGYKFWSNYEGKKVTYRRCGETKTAMKPTMGENLRYFFSYQVNYMYWRYFLWNFSGRQNDIQGTMGEPYAGNWLTGIHFIDKLLIGDLDNMPRELKENKGYNRYYLLPLLLGILGLLAQAYRGRKGAQQFWITFFLFFMTGLAILFYLNQTPNQPRERDYAYAGSFYAFCIWIGMAVPAFVKVLRRVMPESVAASLATLLCLCVPVLMACENWDDHDRSGRYTCRDFAYNYLVGCEENAIIFTNGDNDTFPLWYIQEVEGVRTDVRVCNLSYLQTDWYYSQMMRPYYESEAFDIGWTKPMYMNGHRDVVRIMPRRQDSISVQQAMAWLESDKEFTKKVPGYPEPIDNIPSNRLFLEVDAEKVKANGYLDESFNDRILPAMQFNLKGKSYLGKHEIMPIKLMEEYEWSRPIYFAITVDPNLMSIYRNYFIHEGLVFKLAPVRAGVNVDRMYENLCENFRWGNIQDPTVYLDENITRMCRTQRQMFGVLIEQLMAKGDHERALKAIDRCFEVFPKDIFPVNYVDAGTAGVDNIVEAYYKMDLRDEARALLDEALAVSMETLDWIFGMPPFRWTSFATLANNQLYVMQSLLYKASAYDESVIDAYQEAFTTYASKFKAIR